MLETTETNKLSKIMSTEFDWISVILYKCTEKMIDDRKLWKNLWCQLKIKMNDFWNRNGSENIHRPVCFSMCRVAWRTHCQGDTDSYTADCTPATRLKNDSSVDRERKPQLTAQPENPQTQEQKKQLQQPVWLWPVLTQPIPTGWLFFWERKREKD